MGQTNLDVKQIDEEGGLVIDTSKYMGAKLIAKANEAKRPSLPDDINLTVTIRSNRSAYDLDELSFTWDITFTYCDPIWGGNGGVDALYFFATVRDMNIAKPFADWKGEMFSDMRWYSFDTSGCASTMW